ncbi:hypothetical protein Zm00014a_016649 [Zea mays]|uniref:Uncharacterized protein n=1 Tax=Zea mays TaxID=4577 RepID=A0A3L6GDE4_MAIZE|nr:hypothetical protein Zm00014a_016649 [Zea mays]
MWLALSSRSHTRTQRSLPPEYSAWPPRPTARAFTAAVWRDSVATRW